MKTIHPAVAEHVIEENCRLREALRRIADLPIDPCSTENDYRLSGAKAIAEGALSQQAEPVRSPGTEDAATMLANGSQEPAPAQDERESVLKELEFLMDAAWLNNKTMAEAIFDAGFRRPAQTEQQPEQSGLSNNVFIVWNERAEEGVVFADLADAQYAATGRPMPGTFGVSTIGDAFRETYADDEPGLEFPIIRAALSTQGPKP